jgi:hypothetical protein
MNVNALIYRGGAMTLFKIFFVNILCFMSTNMYCNFTASDFVGDDQLTCGPGVTIGSPCNFTGYTFSWTSKDTNGDPDPSLANQSNVQTPNVSPSISTAYTLELTNTNEDPDVTSQAVVHVIVINGLYLSAEGGGNGTALTECMEGRQVEYAAFLDATIPITFNKKFTYRFDYIDLDGNPDFKIIMSSDTESSITEPAPKVLAANDDHYVNREVSCNVTLEGNEGVGCLGTSTSLNVYELWIDYFRDEGNTPVKDWKVVVGHQLEYNAISSNDCVDWEWDMPEGFPDQWNPIGGGNTKSGTMMIPNSDMPYDFNWSHFGDVYGGIYVSCEDGTEIFHEIYSRNGSSDNTMWPEVGVKIFFDKNAKTNPGGEKPNWFYYWREFVDWGPYAQELKHAPVAGNLMAIASPQNERTTVFDFSSENNNITQHSGIRSFYETLMHEDHHHFMWDVWWWGAGNPADPNFDNDYDWYPNDWEEFDPDAIAAGFDKDINNNNSTNHIGDEFEEAKCQEVEVALTNNGQYNQFDWSYDNESDYINDSGIFHSTNW